MEPTRFFEPRKSVCVAVQNTLQTTVFAKCALHACVKGFRISWDILVQS